MRTIALRGFGLRRYGRLGKYFADSVICPDPPRRRMLADWRASDVDYIARIDQEDRYRRQTNEGPLVIGFSDGGTLAHDYAQMTPDCRGLIVHSGMFRDPVGVFPRCPVLLIVIVGDRTPTYDETWDAFWYYKENGVDVSIVEVDPPASALFPHQFRHALVPMAVWTRATFGEDLPLAEPVDWQSETMRTAARDFLKGAGEWTI